MENDWETKINEWLSGESPAIQWLIDKLWIIAVELEAIRIASGKTKFKVPLHRKGFNNEKDLEDTSIILSNSNSQEFITVIVGEKPIKVVEADILKDPRTEIELTDGFKYLYAWLRRIKYPEEISNFNAKVFLKQIFKKFEFPKKQRKLLYALADGKPHETKSLRKPEEVNTNDLASLKKATLERIKNHKLDKTLVIRGKKESKSIITVSYYYQLEIHPEFFKLPKIVIDKK